MGGFASCPRNVLYSSVCSQGLHNVTCSGSLLESAGAFQGNLTGEFIVYGAVYEVSIALLNLGHDRQHQCLLKGISAFGES